MKKLITIFFIFNCIVVFSQNSELEVSGEVKVKGNNSIELGVGVPKQLDAGKIAYSRWTPNTLEIVGGGLNDQVRKLKFWNEGGANFVGNLGVGIDSPTQKLDVNGLVYTRQGVMFPDQTVQNTAAINTPIIYPNEKGFKKNQPFALIVTGALPTILDTLEIIEIIGGGLQQNVSLTQGSVSLSNPVNNEFRLKINLENATQTLFQRLTLPTQISKFTIYFPELNSNLFTKTIELRNSYLNLLNVSSNHVGNNEYVNVLELGIIYSQIEIRSISNNTCFCYSFTSNTICNCD